MGLEEALKEDFGLTLPVKQWLDTEKALNEEGLRTRIRDLVREAWSNKRERMEPGVADQLEKQLMLQVIDRHWKEHLSAMDYLRKSIHLRGYAQKNPEQEYKREAFQLFEQLLSAVKLELVETLSRLHVPTAEEVAAMQAQREAEARAMTMQFEHPDAASGGEVDGAEVELTAPEMPTEDVTQPFVRDVPKVGRNEPCPCGSGKKYKHCHGQLT